MNIKLEDLEGIWRSIIKHGHYFDLSITIDNKFLYDEIINGERVITSSLIGKIKIEPDDLPNLILDGLKLQVIFFDKDKGFIVLKYPDESNKEFQKLK